MLVKNSERPVLLTDCDNVLLNWLAGVPRYLESIELDASHLLDILNSNTFIAPTVLFGVDCHETAMEHMRSYNESEHMTNLSLIEDASVGVLQRLSKRFDIIVVTNISNNPISKTYRTQNLQKHYGDIFSDVVCLLPFSNKASAIADISKKRDVRLFVDDCLSHVKEAESVGVHSYQYTYNMTCGRNTGEVSEVDSWLGIEALLSK